MFLTVPTTTPLDLHYEVAVAIWRKTSPTWCKSRKTKLNFVFSHDEIQDSVARFSIPVSQLVTATGEFTNWWVQTEVYPKLLHAIQSTLSGTPQGHFTMPHHDKPLEHITLGDLAINSIDNAVEDMDLQGQSYFMFSLV
jgi:hypothetical protein